ncbi:MAG: hypothetical protein WCD68_17625, partial [Candidatus Acidiferrum sp.]
MLNLDVSKAVPRTALVYLTALIPGLFFEVSILLGNPELVGNHLAKTQHAIPLSPYLELAIALFLAFILGNAFMLFVGLIQLLMCYMHRLRLVLKEELTRWALLPLLNRLFRFRFFASRQRFNLLRNRVAKRVADPERPERVATQAWHRLAGKILQQRYGLDLRDLTEEWEFLFWSIGTPTDVEWRGHLLMIASEATGWCGLVATLLAPALGNRYYLALCLLFILLGVHNDYWVALR